MENSGQNISIAEKKWLKLLFEYSQEKFTLNPLPSHDHFHHLRVWKYAKAILSNLAVNAIEYSEQEIEKLIIAVFFHDLGMTINREKEHGSASRNLCNEFFMANPSLAPAEIKTILDMIETHDDKGYANSVSSHNRPALSVILNISDDLDAFGAIGVYRYIEIYHFRSVPSNEFSKYIIPNIKARFDHFAQHFGQLERFITFHRMRYELTRNFFLSLENDFKNLALDQGSAWKKMNVIIEFSNGSDPDIHSLLTIAEKNKLTILERKFFLDLIDEWDGIDSRIQIQDQPF